MDLALARALVILLLAVPVCAAGLVAAFWLALED